MVPPLSLLPVDSAMLLSMLIEEYVCKKFQDYDPLNKALLGIYMERKDRSAKGKLGG